MRTLILIITILCITVAQAQFAQDTGKGNPITSGKYTIAITLAKHEYKQYEPVIAKFVLVNHDSVPLNIYDLFDNRTDGPNIMVSDDKGNKWSLNKIGVHLDFVYSRPFYVIQPNETLFVSMPINNWASSLGKNVNDYSDIYFDQYGVFAPGNYKAYYFLRHDQESAYGTGIQSNEVEFEVTENDKVDNDVLRLDKEKNFQAIKDNYPNSPLLEHVLADEITRKHYTIMSNPNYDALNSLEGDYENFFTKFPNSFFLLSDWFLKPYLYKFFIERKSSQEVKDVILNRISNNLLTEFLSTENRIENLPRKKK